jgi:RibD C-terminal domain
MSKVSCQISVSVDGYVAGPNQSLDNPLGEGGMRLHEWAFATDAWNEAHGRAEGERTADSDVAAEREPLEMQGGTTFHFVTDGIESALEQARAAADDDDVSIAGGASTVNLYLAAGLLDELYLHVAPVVLGGGERLFVGAGDPKLEPVEVVASPAATHVRYRVAR